MKTIHYTQRAGVSRAQVEQLKQLAGGKADWPYSDGVHLLMTVVLDDGYEIDFKICEGQPHYLDVVLFSYGDEVHAWDPADDVLGEYMLHLEQKDNSWLDNDVIILVEVVEAESMDQ